MKRLFIALGLLALTFGSSFATTISAPNEPCLTQTKSTADFESGTSGGQIVAGAAGTKTYICGLVISSSTAANISLDEGTGSSVCTGGTTAGVFLNTGATAANGASFGATSGGISYGFGGATVAKTANAGNNLCVIFTTTNTPQVNVHVTYIQQ